MVLFKKFKKGNCPYCNGPMKIETISSYEMDMEEGIPCSFDGTELIHETLVCKSCGKRFKENSIKDTFVIENSCYDPVIDLRVRRFKKYNELLEKRRDKYLKNDGRIIIASNDYNPFGGKNENY